MALPVSINTTYTAASPVKSADLNDIQACIVAGKHGDKVKNINGLSVVQISGTAISKSFSFFTTAGACVLNFQPDLHQGDRIKQVSLRLSGNSVADIPAFDVYKVSAVGVETLLGTIAITNPPAGVAEYVNNFADYQLAAGETVRVTLNPNAANLDIWGCFVTYDRP